MSIDKIGVGIARDLAEMTKMPSSNETKDSGFAAHLGQQIDEVNRMLNSADQKNMEVVTGKSENLHDAMITFEKDETALKLLTQVRNKAIDAYQEIMRMQV